ncbi:v-type proton atpase subunit a [Anaeramoeba flamelloides]|uniref:V-type proton ATPase subunit a n=1 Tax=Anaeramoeba flamelloides TaxID=1746091 RepID=A0AAV7ZDS4_9EUKA|nr:v-type proton atpase subunit a [Anaeramoeba flamelloides]
MGELFRSVPMTMIRLLIPNEAVHETVHEIGNLGKINFKDLNSTLSAFQRPFTAEVRRLDEIEKKLNFFRAHLDEIKVKDIPKDRWLTKEQEKEILLEDLEALEGVFEDTENDLKELLKNEEELKVQQLGLFEQILLIEKVNDFLLNNDETLEIDFPKEHKTKEVDLISVPLLEMEKSSSDEMKTKTGLQYVSGTIPRERVPILERILWRTTRGNMFLRTAEIETKIKEFHTNKFVTKTAFLIFYQGETIGDKIRRVCTSMGSNLYNIPENQNERNRTIENLRNQLQDLKDVIVKSKNHKVESLILLRVNFPIWYERIHKEKAIYSTMNLFRYDQAKKCLIAEAWIPEDTVADVRHCLAKSTEASGAMIPTILDIIENPPKSSVPPTHFPVTEFQKGFQAIIDSYGIANYREVNPTPFTIITFPFLFGVMFGDFGHGILLTIFAIWVLMNSKKLGIKAQTDEIIKILYDGRYIIFMMGLFSVYCGFIYNEIFAVSMNWFGTCWEPRNNSTVLDLKTKTCTYPVGVDPSWAGTTTELLYADSLKMKLSVLLGISQMLLGCVLSLLNHIHFKKWLNIWFEFIPQMLLLLSFFGYMCFLIIYKWVTNWSHREGQTGGIHLITTLINMFLKPMGMKSDQIMFKNQNAIQLVLILIFVLTIPLMLIPKPLILRHRAKKRKKEMGFQRLNEVSSSEDDNDDKNKNKRQDHDHEEEFQFSEVMIHQLIHTIEFVLGSISNTASYLRLWALSLAHSQLSKVFWEMIFLTTAKMEKIGFISIFIGFCVWAVLSVIVLLVMECLSAFLHALRLHWVEFNSKFYVADGSIKFEPFSFKEIKQEAKNYRS